LVKLRDVFARLTDRERKELRHITEKKYLGKIR